MINPNEINLIIFDLHGTVSDSVKPMYEAIKRAYTRLGWEVFFSEKELERYLGAPSDEYYRLITPKEKIASWQETRKAIREESERTFKTLARPYPGAKETLETLKRRGYRLALYSGSSGRRMDSVIGPMGIKHLFDYIKNPEDNSLNKTELAKKLIERFKAKAAIVGDSIQDIEAARATGSLSIGALYGYGGEEPEQADITINEFGELLTIFNTTKL
jgi:phosphoglycolate phosphatase